LEADLMDKRGRKDGSGLQAGSSWDVAVVGAGPAGSMVARELARLGSRVVLLDRQEFPRWKVCGACLSPGAQEVLRRAGLGDLPARQGAWPLDVLRLRGWSMQADLQLQGTVALSRGALDSALAEAAEEAGVLFVPGARARLERVTPEAAQLQVGLPEGAVEIAARVVVAADGLRSGILARAGGSSPGRDGGSEVHGRGARVGKGGPGDRTVKLGDGNEKIGVGAAFGEVPSGYQAGVIHMAVGEEGYVGLVRTEDGHLNVGAAVRASAVGRERSPAEVVARILRQASFPALEGEPLEGWRGTPGLSYHPLKLGGERVFAVGDAAGYVEPFTGEGMSWAMGGALALAPIVRRAVDGWNGHHLEEWQTAYGRSVGRAQRVCRGAAWTLNRPGLSRAALRVLRAVPRAAAPFVAGAAAPPPLSTGSTL
jgi:menaquinone-9 beta-reductase